MEAAEPRSRPVLYNLTAVSVGAGSQRGMTLKAGTAGEVHNAIFLGHSLEAIDVQGEAVVANLQAPDLRPGVIVRDVAIVPPPEFDEGATYAGAFAPEGDPWTVGWTAFPRN